MIGQEKMWILRCGGQRDLFYWSFDPDCERFVPVWELSVSPDDYAKFCKIFARDQQGPFSNRTTAIEMALRIRNLVASKVVVSGIYRPRMPILRLFHPGMQMPGQPSGLTAPVR